MNTTKILKIESNYVENVDVYNLELESLELADDLFWVENISGVISHNCVRKDPLMLNEHFPESDFALAAYKLHEYMPKLVLNLTGNLQNEKVLVLGYTFKRNTDDTRDSLVPKLLRYIHKQVPSEVIIHEPFLPYGKVDDKQMNNMEFVNTENPDFTDAIVIIGAPHSIFEAEKYQSELKKAKKVIDITGLIWK